MMQQVLFRDLDSLFEKFSIMSEQEDVGSRKALDYLQNKTTPELFNQLQVLIWKCEKCIQK